MLLFGSCYIPGKNTSFVALPTSFSPLLASVTAIGGRATLKMLRCKSKMQFVNQERRTQNAPALLNYLKRIAPQQLMLRMQV
jgi:hypothetical protein